MANQITIYTRNNCPYCLLLKRFLDMKKAEYVAINMDEDAEALNEVLAMTGRTIAPTTIIVKADGTKEVVSGYNLAKIAPAI